MINPIESDIGRSVLYKPPHLVPGEKAEQGFITKFNDEHVFVRFGSNSWGSACKRENLEWEFPDAS